MTFVHVSQGVRLCKPRGAETNIGRTATGHTMADMTSRAARRSTVEEGKMNSVGHRLMSPHQTAAESGDHAWPSTGAR